MNCLDGDKVDGNRLAINGIATEKPVRCCRFCELLYVVSNLSMSSRLNSKTKGSSLPQKKIVTKFRYVRVMSVIWVFCWCLEYLDKGGTIRQLIICQGDGIGRPLIFSHR